MDNNGKPVIDFSHEEFKTASGSHGGKKQCVAVAIRPEGIGIRDSKNPNEATLHFTPGEWKVFIKGVKAGEFDKARTVVL